MAKSISLKTPIPGPRSRALLRRNAQSVSAGMHASIPVFAAAAHGALVRDVDGNTFIDFSGGIGATNSGHGNPAIVQAVKRQSERFFHTCYSVIGYEPYLEVCELLNKITPGKFKKKSVLFNSGAEAVENAVKIARKYTGRQAVVSFEEGFHGRTLMTLSLTGKINPYKSGFGPFAPETYKLHYPYVYRRPSRMDEGEYIDYLLEYIDNDFFRDVVAPQDIACIVMEPVTGEGGFIVPPKRYVKELYKRCKEHGILLVMDEIQSGFCRTGKLFASEHFGVEPDLITTGKSLSNGLPLSGVTGRMGVMDAVQEGGMGGTFVGNPLSCVAAKEAIRFMLKRKLWERADAIGTIVQTRFNEFAQEFKWVGDVRGLGAMQALELVKSKKTKAADKARAESIVRYAYRNGLLLLFSGVLGNDIRTLMSLVITDAQLEEGLAVLETAMRKTR